MISNGTYVFAVEGLDAFKTVDAIPDEIKRAGQLAVNATARRGNAEAGRVIRKDIKFPAGYLTGTKGRIQITKFATPDDLEAQISARSRPTSLARFVKGSPGIGGAGRAAGVTIEVKPGSAMRLKRAFLIRLRSGNADDGPNANLGLAVRTKPGQSIRGSSRALRLSDNLWLLYGPSVSQAFVNASGSGAAKDISPALADYLESEFLRLVDLDL